jgi:Rrf2 family nitric oxide-sensitive transcriptional repressor
VIRINRQTDYAIRVLLVLAKRPEGTRLATPAIGEEMLIPKAFLTRIVAQLAQAGLVVTFPGRDGGLQLPRPAGEITLWDVVDAMEGPFLLSECMTGDAACPFEASCPVRLRWGRLQKAFMEELAKTTFEELALETVNISGPVAVLPVNS